MSTVTQQPSQADSLALVNSFYGPGATACWYLTCLSCLISWTLHPKKRMRDAITSDFIAAVTFPTVASAHLVSQIQNWPTEPSVNDETLVQMRASLAASLIITETFLSLCIILLLPGLFARTPKRLCLLAATGVFCVLTETYLYFALPSVRQAPGVFERSFIIDSFPLLFFILGLAFILVGFLLAYLFLLFRRTRPDPIAEQPAEADLVLEEEDGLARRPLSMPLITVLALPGMLLSGSSSVVPPTFDLLGRPFRIYKENKTSWTGRRSFIDEFFPTTEVSIMDLDQAVALLAGMTVLGFSLYSAAEARYRRWWTEEQIRLDQEARQRLIWRRRWEGFRTHMTANQLRRLPGWEEVELQDWGRALLTVQQSSSSAT